MKKMIMVADEEARENGDCYADMMVEIEEEPKIFNGTPHSINIVSEGIRFDSTIRKFVTEQPVISATIPTDCMISAKIETVESEPINGIPVFAKKITGCDSIPEGYDIVIVSAMYVSAAKAMGFDTSKCYTIADPVYSTDGKTIVGSRGICPAF